MWRCFQHWQIRKLEKPLFEQLTWNWFFPFWYLPTTLQNNKIKWIFHINSFLSVTISYVNFLNWSYIMKSNFINRNWIKCYIEHGILEERSMNNEHESYKIEKQWYNLPSSINTIKSNSCWCLSSFSFHIIPLLVMEGHNRKD